MTNSINFLANNEWVPVTRQQPKQAKLTIDDSIRRVRMSVSPEQSKEWLKNNTRNRTLSEAKVLQYAMDMEEGRWPYNPIDSAIAISRDGVILNGQHRLEACVVAKRSFETDVIFNAPPELMDYTDIGMVRSSANILQIDGGQYATDRSAVARMLLVYEKHGAMKLDSGLHSPSKTLVCKRASSDSAITDAVKLASAHRQVGKLCSRTMVAFCYYIFSKKNAKIADMFFADLIKGSDLKSTNPAYLLREKLTENRTAKRKLSRIHVLALFFRAWKAYSSGKEMRILKAWRNEGPAKEEFPSI